MQESSKQSHVRSVHVSARAEHRKPSPLTWLLGVLVIAGSISACVARTPSTASSVPTAFVNCFPSSVFTVADMQARVDCHPGEYKFTLSPDTAVLFAFPDATIDWVGPIFIVHIPSVSEAVVKLDGSLFIKDYKSSEGQAAIESVLQDPKLMASILERARQIQAGPLAPRTNVK